MIGNDDNGITTIEFKDYHSYGPANHTMRITNASGSVVVQGDVSGLDFDNDGAMILSLRIVVARIDNA